MLLASSDLFWRLSMQVDGKLFGWFETGLEGIVWALEQDRVAGCDGLFIIEEIIL